jgi:hypothetical protein
MKIPDPPVSRHWRRQKYTGRRQPPCWSGPEILAWCNFPATTQFFSFEQPYLATCERMKAAWLLSSFVTSASGQIIASHDEIEMIGTASKMGSIKISGLSHPGRECRVLVENQETGSRRLGNRANAGIEILPLEGCRFTPS